VEARLEPRRQVGDVGPDAEEHEEVGEGGGGCLPAGGERAVAAERGAEGELRRERHLRLGDTRPGERGGDGHEHREREERAPEAPTAGHHRADRDARDLPEREPAHHHPVGEAAAGVGKIVANVGDRDSAEDAARHARERAAGEEGGVRDGERVEEERGGHPGGADEEDAAAAVAVGDGAREEREEARQEAVRGDERALKGLGDVELGADAREERRDEEDLAGRGEVHREEREEDGAVAAAVLGGRAEGEGGDAHLAPT